MWTQTKKKMILPGGEKESIKAKKKGLSARWSGAYTKTEAESLLIHLFTDIKGSNRSQRPYFWKM